HAWPALPEDKPIFFGHYWLKGSPEVQAPNIACVDYSAAKGGDLVDYRWCGENRLSNENIERVAQTGPDAGKRPQSEYSKKIYGASLNKNLTIGSSFDTVAHAPI